MFKATNLFAFALVYNYNPGQNMRCHICWHNFTSCKNDIFMKTTCASLERPKNTFEVFRCSNAMDGTTGYIFTVSIVL